MKYFCASCQTKHPVNYIAADLRDIARPDVDERIGEILVDNPAQDDLGDDILEFAGDLRKFVNTEAKSRRIFLFWPEEISKHMVGARQNGMYGMVLQGRFLLDMNWLIKAYETSGAYAERFAENYGKSVPVDYSLLGEVSSRYGTQPVFDRKVEKISYMDGCKVYLEDGWVIVRFSGTEPRVRIFAEGRTEEEARKTVRQMAEFAGLDWND